MGTRPLVVTRPESNEALDVHARIETTRRRGCIERRCNSAGARPSPTATMRECPSCSTSTGQTHGSSRGSASRKRCSRFSFRARIGLDGARRRSPRAERPVRRFWADCRRAAIASSVHESFGFGRPSISKRVRIQTRSRAPSSRPRKRYREENESDTSVSLSVRASTAPDVSASRDAVAAAT